MAQNAVEINNTLFVTPVHLMPFEHAPRCTHAHAHTHNTHTLSCWAFLFAEPFTRVYGGYGGDDVIIVLGGRAINHMQVDRQIGAEMVAMILQFSLPPTMFSVCMTDCVEDLTADASTIPEIFSTGYNRALRRLELLGQSSPEDYQSVLQTLVYMNNVPRLCPDDIVISVSDGIHNVTKSIPVVKVNSRRRKSVVPKKHLYMLRHLNSKGVKDALTQDEETAKKSEDMKNVLLVIPVMIVIAAVGMVLVVFHVWKKRNTKEYPCNSP